MLQTIQEFFKSPEFTALFSTVVGFLVSNLGVIVLFALKYIKLQAADHKAKLEHQSTIEALEAKYIKLLDSTYSKFTEKMDVVESAVMKKIAEQDAAEQNKIKEETVKLGEALKETKKALSIDEIIN